MCKEDCEERQGKSQVIWNVVLVEILTPARKAETWVLIQVKPELSVKQNKVTWAYPAMHI